MWWMAIVAAFAEVPADVTPVVAPAEAPAQYAQVRASKGLQEQQLACDPLWGNETLVCFRLSQGEGWRWVTDADLTAWGVDSKALRAAVADRAAKSLVIEPVAVEGMIGRKYWLSTGGRWAAAGALRPDLLVERVGGLPVYVAAPVDGVLIAWRGGDAELDKVVAVGVSKMYESKEAPITPVVWQWDGEAWRPFGEAKPTGP